jgi:Cupin
LRRSFVGNVMAVRRRCFPLALDPWAIHQPHLHTNANKLNYLVTGRARMGLFRTISTRLASFEAHSVCHLSMLRATMD